MPFSQTGRVQKYTVQFRGLVWPTGLGTLLYVIWVSCITDTNEEKCCYLRIPGSNFATFWAICDKLLSWKFGLQSVCLQRRRQRVMRRIWWMFAFFVGLLCTCSLTNFPLLVNSEPPALCQGTDWMESVFTIGITLHKTSHNPSFYLNYRLTGRTTLQSLSAFCFIYLFLKIEVRR